MKKSGKKQPEFCPLHLILLKNFQNFDEF